MSQTINCDIAIIGGGAGGLTVAAVAAQLGMKVVLAEANKMGGDCLNAGCVPSKALLAAAKTAHTFTTAERFGIANHQPSVDFVAVMRHVADVIAQLSPHDSVARFTALGVTVLSSPATFLNKETMLAGDATVKARYFVIATGSSPAIPPISGLETIPYLTNESIFSLQSKPDHLVVIGAGPIGCEMAQAFHLLGVKVTMLEALMMMPRDDTDLVDILRNHLISSGITIHEQIKVLKIAKSNHSVEILIEKNGLQECIKGSHLLVATGRKPNVYHLSLEKAGVVYSAKGIQVNKRLQSTNKRIYAIGDVAGGYQFTHIASYHAGVVIKNILFKWPEKVNYRSIPWVTYTLPPLAHAGLTGVEIEKQYQNIKVITIDFADNDRAVAERETLGKLKVYCTKNGKILGVSILGCHADELIAFWIPLIQQGRHMKEVSNTIIPYPTFNEIAKRAASEFYKPVLFSSKIKYLISWLKW